MSRKEAPSPWARRLEESGAAWKAFSLYLHLGPARTHAKVIRELGKKRHYAPQMTKWSQRHRWKERAHAYDSAELAASLAKRGEQREHARAVLFDAAVDAAKFVVDLMSGRVDVSDDTVAPSTRLQSAIHVLAQAGLVPPKRTEHIHREEEVAERAQRALEQLTVDEIRRLASGAATVH